jgi:hypothetical protein
MTSLTSRLEAEKTGEYTASGVGGTGGGGATIPTSPSGGEAGSGDAMTTTIQLGSPLSLCGGVIGKEGVKFCTKNRCTVRTHTTKAKLEAGSYIMV